MLVLFSPIFVADSKIVFGCNFVAPLKYYLLCMIFPKNTSLKPRAHLRHISKDFALFLFFISPQKPLNLWAP